MKSLKGFEEFYQNNGQRAAMQKYGLAKSTCQNIAHELNVRVKKEVTLRLRSEKMCKKTTSTPGIDMFLKANYLIINYNRLSIKIKRSEQFVKTRLRQLNLVVPREIIEERKKSGQRKPGDVPFSKGKTWAEYMSKESQKRSLKTAFKKGQAPPNTLFNGAIRISYHKKSKKAYKWIRIAQAKWEMLHVHKWEKKNGPVPKGMILVFRDNDSLNVTLKNLELITRVENMRRNSLTQWPEELNEVIELKGKIKRKIYEKQNR